MAYTVRVYGIFTGGSRSSGDSGQRLSRLMSDIAAANRVWGQGFAAPQGNSQTGVSCGINFVFGGTFNYTSRVYNSGNIANAGDPDIEKLIAEVRGKVQNKTAIFVVYLSGNYLKNSTSIGSGGARATTQSGRITSAYGRVVMTNVAGSPNNPYVLAHEAGHVLFGRLNSAGQFIGTEPSAFKDPKDDNHNSSSQNLMYRAVPQRAPFINSDQCVTARRSKVILENLVSAKRKTIPTVTARTARKQTCRCCKPLS